MKKKLLWGAGICLAFFLVSLLVLSLVVKSYLKGERLKALIIPRAEEFTGRKVGIDQIEVSLFKGIVARGITLKEKDGKEDFLTTKEFILDYNLIPLLKKQLVIKRIEVISPTISLKRGSDGRYNFSDILEKERERKRPDESRERREGGLPFSITTDRISVKDARIMFVDGKGELPDTTAKSDIEITVSMGREYKDIAASGHLDLRELKANLRGIETDTTGRIELDGESMRMDLNTSIGKGSVKVSGTVKDYRTSPDVTLNLSAKGLDLEQLMGDGKRESRSASPVKAGGAHDRKPEALKASGVIKVDGARYKGYTVKELAMNYRYRNGVMTMEPIHVSFGGGEGVKAEGTLKGSLQFAYVPGEDAASGVKKTLTGKGGLNLSRCEVRQSKITNALALFTGLDDLRSPKFDAVQFAFTMRNERISLEGTMDSTQIRLNPSGNLYFDQRLDIITDLKVSPALANKLPTRKITQYITDEKGWTVIPLKITGTTDKPSVNLNPAAVGKQIERGVKGEIEKRLFKGTPEKKSGQPSRGKEAEDLLKGILGR